MKNDREIMNLVRTAIDDCTRGIDESPSLQYRIAQKAKGEEPVKKKLSLTAILVIALLCVTVTGALAATLNAWGILDFAGRYQDTYIPPNIEANITKENLTFESDLVTCTVQETYYDGKIFRVTANILPKDGSLLLGPGACPEDSMADLIPDYEGETTIGAYALQRCGGRLTEVDPSIESDWTDCSTDYVLNEDNSLTIYMECQFEEESEDLETPLKLSCFPMTISEEQLEEGEVTFDPANKVEIVIPLTLHSVPVKTYVSTEPMDFTSVGVRVTKVTLTETPLEIRVTVDYEVTDVNAYNAQEDGLWFEFIDPESNETEYYKQRVSGGLTSGGSVMRTDAKDFSKAVEVGATYRQTDSIGLNALSDQYTIRAYNCWDDKPRYETVTFAVTEIEE